MMKMRNVFTVGAAVVLTLCGAVQTAQAVQVGTEIVLLADVSGSVDSTDFALQRGGYEAAFRDAAVINAIEAYGPIAVTFVYWSSSQSVAVPWTLISDSSSANAFADEIAGAARPFTGSTHMADAMYFAADLYADNGFEGNRLVLDVSGDGADSVDEYNGDMIDENVQAARDNLLNNVGVNTINALWIDDRYFFGDDPGDWVNALQYGTTNVIGGEGAFQGIAQDYLDFDSAILAKLEREVSPVPDGGSSAILIGLALGGLGLLRRY